MNFRLSLLLKDASHFYLLLLFFWTQLWFRVSPSGPCVGRSLGRPVSEDPGRFRYLPFLDVFLPAAALDSSADPSRPSVPRGSLPHPSYPSKGALCGRCHAPLYTSSRRKRESPHSLTFVA